jgi:hypothetical protein
VDLHQPVSELTLRIAERANRLAAARPPAPGRELELWLEAEAQVKRELSRQGAPAAAQRHAS